VSLYDWLLFLHVLSAFAVVAGLVLVTAAILLSLRPGPDPSFAVSLTRFSPLLFDAAGLAILVFGVWLAIEVDAYQVWDGWILAALVLWVVIAAAGARALGAFRRARRTTTETTDLAAAVRSTRAPLWNAVALVATLATLVLMIWKPGA
jgi:uncharacterized membrane protein